MSAHYKRVSAAGLLVALGIIYGDIGTSPLYTFQTILTEGGSVNEGLVFGAISCIFWTLTLQTTFKYVIITLQADNHGEGGVFSLYALVRRHGATYYSGKQLSARNSIGYSFATFYFPTFWNQSGRQFFWPYHVLLVCHACHFGHQPDNTLSRSFKS